MLHFCRSPAWGQCYFGHTMHPCTFCTVMQPMTLMGLPDLHRKCIPGYDYHRAYMHNSTVSPTPRCLSGNSTAVIQLDISRPVCMELYQDCRELGRFMLRSGDSTIAAGVVTKVSCSFLPLSVQEDIFHCRFSDRNSSFYLTLCTSITHVLLHF